MTVDCLRDGSPMAGQHIEVTVPEGWRLQSRTSDGCAFTITAAQFTGSARITASAKVQGKRFSAAFTVLSPEAAPGFPSAQNVERCPKCQGRQSCCLCGPEAG